LFTRSVITGVRSIKTVCSHRVFTVSTSDTTEWHFIFVFNILRLQLFKWDYPTEYYKAKNVTSL